MMFYAFLRQAQLASFVLSVASASSVYSQELPDNFLWLEEIESTQSLDWAKSRSQKAIQRLESVSTYKAMEAEFREIHYSKDRIPAPIFIGTEIFNFWQDAQHVRGILRKTSRTEFEKSQPVWNTVLDIDGLATKENENWVYKGIDCLPQHTRCLISLSRGGKDAVVVREFDLATNEFVSDGFVLPEAKHRISWVDANRLVIGTDWGPDSLTHSGYPRILKIWKRGTPLSEAEFLFEGPKTSVSVWGGAKSTSGGAFIYAVHALSFYEKELYFLNSSGKMERLPAPNDIEPQGVFGDQILFSLRTDWLAPQGLKKAGSLLSADLGDLALVSLKVVFEPTQTQFLDDVAFAADAIYTTQLNNVSGDLWRYTFTDGTWTGQKVNLPSNGALSITASSESSSTVALNFASFLQPTSQYFVDGLGQKYQVSLLKKISDKFDATPYETQQLWATSPDGTKIPYFLIRKKGQTQPGPALLTAYGGFEIPSVPYYLNGIGKAWMDRGGSYVLANIRGGGEFGPKWHEAAILKNRHKAFEDFIAVSEDLISRKITTPSQLGIRGGSNGGLLVSTVTMMRPDLFSAVVCQVPLTDMLRYHLLLAGASWMAEYGNPDEPSMHDYLMTYSPYQRISQTAKYPEMFVTTSTKDDRVHPAHARKLVARLEEFGHPVLYYENVNGGHAGSSNLEERIKLDAKIWSYLASKLMGAK